jgi:cyclophilin family peptidyl-prolyl cis-trans isomerase
MLHQWVDCLNLRVLLIAGISAACASCGGGGGGGASPSPPDSGGVAPPNQPPVAVAKLSSPAVAGAATVFDTVGTRDADGTLASRNWVYGDGQSGTADSHIYKLPGAYTAVYTATDDKGASATASVTVTVAKCSQAGLSAAQLSPYPSVCIQTSLGELVVEVFPAQAPKSSAAFLKYVDDGFYENTIFHRVIRDFVAQVGGFTSGMVPKPATYAPIVLESDNGLKNWQYTMAMARGPQPNSATSQFFINFVANPGLDFSPSLSSPNGYAVFGQVISGTAIVDQIANLATGSVAGFTDVPSQDVVVRSTLRLP